MLNADWFGCMQFSYSPATPPLPKKKKKVESKIYSSLPHRPLSKTIMDIINCMRKADVQLTNKNPV